MSKNPREDLKRFIKFGPNVKKFTKAGYQIKMCAGE